MAAEHPCTHVYALCLWLRGCRPCTYKLVMTIIITTVCAPQMTKNVSAAAAEAEAERQKRNKAGLDAVLASLQAAKKVNVLDKSRSDWDTFKQSDTKARTLPTSLTKTALLLHRHSR